MAFESIINQGMSARLRPLPVAVAMAVMVCGLVACDGLMDVEFSPHEIDASQPIPLEEMMVGATADLFLAYDSYLVWGGLFHDELTYVGTSGANFVFSQRQVRTTDHGRPGRGRSIAGPFYVPMQKAAFVSKFAQERILSGEFEAIPQPASSPELARVSTFAGFARTWLADMYCTVAFDGTGPENPSAEVYALAEGEFSQAIEAANADPEILQAALVGRARVRLILGDDAGALADAQRVAPEFEYVATYSTNSFEQRNRVHFRIWDFANVSVAPAFVDLTIDDTGVPDPRVALAINPVPAYEPSQTLYAPHKVSTPSSPLRIASGDETQYIIAEVMGGQTAVEIINEIRGRYGIDVEWSPVGDEPTEIRDKVIDERRRTLFLDGVRFGDLRRYLDRYGLDHFPTSIPQGFPMGDQTCFPLPDIERNNNPDI